MTTIWQKFALVTRFCVAAFGILSIFFVTVALIIWLVLTKQTQVAVAQPAERQAEQIDERVEQLQQELQTLRAQHHQQVEAWKKLRENYKAQIVALTAKVNKSDDQLMVLNEAAQHKVVPMTHREVDAKTYQLLGIKGVTR